MPHTPPLACRLAFLGFLVASCEVDEVVDPGDEAATELCSPTGEMLDDTGVVLGPGGCERVALQDLGNGQTWLMNAGWNVEGAPLTFFVVNESTGGYYLEDLFDAQSQVALHIGTYGSDGLRVKLGTNALSYRLWRQVFDEVEEPAYQEVQAGRLDLEVTLAED